MVCHSNGSHNRIFACCQALYGQRVNANRFTLYTSYLGYACYKPVANGGSLRFWYCRTICLGFDRIRYSYERLDLGTTVEYSSRSYGCFSRDFHTHQNSKSQGKRCAKTCKVGQSSKFLFNCAFFMAITFAPAFLPTDNIIVATLIRFMAIVPITLALDATKEIITYWGKRAEADES